MAAVAERPVDVPTAGARPEPRQRPRRAAPRRARRGSWARRPPREVGASTRRHRTHPRHPEVRGLVVQRADLLGQRGRLLVGVGLLGVPGRLVPELDAAVDAGHDDLAGQVGVLAQVGRDDDPPELVRHEVVGAGEEVALKAAGVGLHRRERPDPLGQARPAVRRQHVEAAIDAFCQVQSRRQVRSEIAPGWRVDSCRRWCGRPARETRLSPRTAVELSTPGATYPHVFPQFPTREAIVGPAGGPDNGKRRTRAAIWALVRAAKRDVPGLPTGACGTASARCGTAAATA